MADVVPLSRDSLRSRRKRLVRAKTISSKRTTQREIRYLRLLADTDLAELGPVDRPKTRADCVNGPRPCPWVSCKHHLYLDVSPATRAVKINFPDIGAEDLPPDGSCALDIADGGAQTLEQVADHTNVTRERIRQLEDKTLQKLYALGDPALREHAGANGDRPVSSFKAGLRGEDVRVSRAVQLRLATRASDEGEDQEHVDWRARDAEEQMLDAARTGSIAGHLMKAFQMPLRLALQRAREYADEFPGEMPEGVELVMPEKRRGPVISLHTPPERRTEPPKSVEHMVPSAERGDEVRIGVVEDEELDVEAEPQPVAHRDIKPATVSRALRAKASSASASSSVKETAMPLVNRTPESDRLGEAIVAHLKEHGPAGRAALCEATGAARNRVDHALRILKADGAVEVRGKTNASRWSIAGDPRADAPAPTLAYEKPSKNHVEIAVLELLGQGPKTGAELIASCGGQAANVVTKLRKAGRATNDGRGTPWRLVSGGGLERWLEQRNAKRKQAEEVEMSFQEDVYAALQKAGNATAEELASKMGEDRVRVSSALRAMLVAKKVDRHGGHKGASWEPGTGKSTKTVSETRPPQRVRAKRASGNGHANGHAKANGHAAPPPAPTAPASADPVAAALLALRDALTNKHAQQMQAIETLLKG